MMNTVPSTEIDNKKGFLTVISGPMFSGKTLEILKRIKTAADTGNPLCFIPKIDTRYGESVIASHNGDKISARTINTSCEILSFIGNKKELIFIDEGQFLDEDLPKTIQELVKQGHTVTISGLNRKHNKEYFPVMKTLIEQSDTHIQKTGNCAICNEPSIYSYRKTRNNSDILIGSNDHYESRCPDCFHKN